MKKIKCYIPGQSFPAVSITGKHCQLLCPHCMGRPLENMVPAEDPESLIEIAENLQKKGAIGFLLSGGFDSDGVLPISGYLQAIRMIKDTTTLKINAHPGFLRLKDASDIVSSGIDVFSITYPINDHIGREFFMTPNALERYRETVSSLHEGGADNIIPHFLVGLSGLDEELEGLREFEKDPPDNLVIISYTPFVGISGIERQPPTDDHILSFVKGLKEALPGTKIVFGCMRERGREDLERQLIENYLDGIVLPNRKALKDISDRVEIEEMVGCCALYL